MKLSFNMSAIVANNKLNQSDNSLADSLERLSTGYKINHAKDNPAGLAISRKMRAQIKGLGTAADIASKGISVIETAEGALSEMQAMTQRMNELSIQASNGTATTADRAAIQEEISALCEEINRLATETDFNGNTLLDGSYDLKGYTSSENVKIEYYSDETYAKKYSVSINNTTTPLTVGLVEGFPAGAKVQVDGNYVTIKGNDKFQIEFEVSDTFTGTENPVELDITGMGAMTLQIGANEGQELDIRIPKISLEKLNLADMDVTTEESARKAIDKAKSAISYISSVRSKLGAYQNRLESTISSLEVTEENMNQADSRIMDTDMAEEMSEYTKYQTLSQAGISMLSQANERPEKVLQLLQ